jgi:heterodisulfide reductase subunit A
MELVASAVAKATLLQPLEERQTSVAPAALIIGGGIAGMQAALDIADAGFAVTLVERAPQLGGHAAQLHQTYPTLEPVAELVDSIIERVNSHPRLTVLTGTEVVKVDGYVGNFLVHVQRGDEMNEIPVGVIVVATGFEVFDARRKPEFGYGVYPEVITTLDFEQLVNLQSLSLDLKSVVFIQCVGSRDQSIGNPYCSRVCCMVTAKQAEGVIYRRGNPAEIIRRNGRVVVRAEDTLLGELVEVEADLVVLAGSPPQTTPGGYCHGRGLPGWLLPGS